MASNETMILSRQQQRSDTDFSIATNLPSTPNEAPGQSPRQSNDLSYMHRPPTIMPNYGKKSRGSVLPKSNVSRVLLYDNITQQTMLDVRLNSIQSQSYKTNRELEMHMKSFISRRKARQKALKNLTRVQHHDDYFEFQQQQQQQQQVRQQRIPFGSFGSESPEEQRLPDHGNPFLPQIGYRSSSFHPRANHPSPGISCLRKHAKSVNSTRETYRPDIANSHKGNTACEDDANENDESNIDFDASYHINDNRKLQTGGSRNVESLPQISMSAPSNITRNNKVISGKYQSLNQDNKVGYKMVKGPNGYTRIFHALQEADFDQRSPAMDFGVENSVKHHKLLPLRRGSQNRLLRLKDNKRRVLSKHGLEDFSLDQYESSVDGAENYGDHSEEPLSDFRFLHLRQVLIPQDPPNEGYTELSPSFPRHYPAIRDVVVMAKNRRKKERKGGQHDGGGIESDDESMYSEGASFSECTADGTGDVGDGCS